MWQTHHPSTVVLNALIEFHSKFPNCYVVSNLATGWSHCFMDCTKATGGMLWESKDSQWGSGDHTKQLWQLCPLHLFLCPWVQRRQIIKTSQTWFVGVYSDTTSGLGLLKCSWRPCSFGFISLYLVLFSSIYLRYIYKYKYVYIYLIVSLLGLLFVFFSMFSLPLPGICLPSGCFLTTYENF